jgi:hypothetical protein
MTRHLTIFALSAALTLAPLAAMAADQAQPPEPTQSGTLAPGPAAGVEQAQSTFGTSAYIMMGAIAAGLIIIVASSGNGGGHAAVTTNTVP